MIRQITRVGPTLNGLPTIGHLFICLVNEHEAHSTDGKFIIRFDDTQRFWLRFMGGHEAMVELGKQWREDLEWCGVFADEYCYESAMEENARFLLRDELNYHMPDSPFTYPLGPNVVGKIEQYYPYTPDLTALKVVYDCLQTVTHLIRGTDLVSEYSLYQYFAERFGIRPPIHTYIPRLTFPGQEISKTLSNGKIGEFRQRGMSPVTLREQLAEACLVNPHGSWTITNIKENPEW